MITRVIVAHRHKVFLIKKMFLRSSLVSEVISSKIIRPTNSGRYFPSGDLFIPFGLMKPRAKRSGTMVKVGKCHLQIRMWEEL